MFVRSLNQILKLGSLFILLSSFFIVPFMVDMDHNIQHFIILAGLMLSSVFFTSLFFGAKIRKIRHTSLLDPVTGLYNYKEFNNRLEQEKSRTKRTDNPFALLLIDIDHFKKFNSTFGYKQADKIMLQLLEVIKSELRKSDTLFRYRNGDEFVILASHTDKEGGERMALRINESINNADFKIHSKPVTVSVSIGVSAYHNFFNSLEEDAFSDLSRKKDQKVLF